MLDNLSPLSNSTSTLLESWIWSEYSHGLAWAKQDADIMFPHSMHPNIIIQPHTCWKSSTLNWSYNNTTKWKANKVAPVTVRTLTIPFSLSFWCTYTLAICRVARCQGNVRENKFFSRSVKSQGILKKCQGILAIWPMSGNCQGILSCHVRELSGNFVVTFF